MDPPPPRPAPAAAAVLLLAAAAALVAPAGGVEILSESPVERCALDSGAGGRLACDRKIVLNLAVPSGASGGEASLVVEVEENDTQAMQTIRDPPAITINKSAAYALYAITYIRDVAYRPEEQFVRTRKCESDAGAEVVKSCERLRDQKGHIIEHTEVPCFWNWDKVTWVQHQSTSSSVTHAGVHTLSVGITEILNTNLLIELSADDIEYVYQRSPGKIISINAPTFEALSQVGTAQVTIKNIGKLEASYSLTFDCLSGITYVEEQFFIMKPDEVLIRSFYLRSSTEQASKYRCAAILKASDFSELDRAECQFSTTATVLDNETQIGPSNWHVKDGIRGFFEAIKALWRNTWDSVIDFFTGRSCSTRCSSFFDFSRHIQYICIGWLVMFGLLLLILPAVAVLLWLLHQMSLFDPLYDWWEDMFGPETYGLAHPKHKRGGHHVHSHHHHHQHRQHAHKRRSGVSSHHRRRRHHRHGGQQGQPDPAAERHGRHDSALGVQRLGAQAPPARQGGGRAPELEGRRRESQGAAQASREARRAQARPRAPPLPGRVKI